MPKAINEIESWFNAAVDKNIITEEGISLERIDEIEKPHTILLERSVVNKNDLNFFLLVLDRKKLLVIHTKGDIPAGFEGVSKTFGEGKFMFCPLSHQNAAALRHFLPYTAPVSLSDKASTFGVGDRLGIAGPGHIRLFKSFKASPVLAQQSVREVELTGRTFEDVLDASTWAVFQEGFKGEWGADGDHLKTEKWVRKAVSIGFTMITADVSDYIKSEMSDAPVDIILENYETIDPHYRERVESFYLEKKWPLDCNLEIRFTKEDLARAVVVYRDAIDHAKRLYEAALKTGGEGSFDFELSVDETPAPTTPQAHIFVAQELQIQGVAICSVAPRFVGEFQKGIDYIGDVGDFEKTFRIHAAIARTFGHKVSVHSGSDKFSIFPAVGKLSSGKFHVKTSKEDIFKTLEQHIEHYYKQLHEHIENHLRLLGVETEG